MSEDVNPYEAAVKWIEEEVHKNGIFEVRAELGDSYDHKTGVTRQAPTGRLEGFTVTSQHTKGRAFNLLQLVMEMRGDYEDLRSKKAEMQFKKLFRVIKKK